MLPIGANANFYHRKNTIYRKEAVQRTIFLVSPLLSTADPAYQRRSAADVYWR